MICGKLITKEKRQQLFGIVAGGAGSRKPEDYQRRKIIEGTGLECPKTNTRINLRIKQLQDIAYPNIKKDGFDYTEDFDGVQTIHSKTIYINLKCIVGKGGSQTRSLREVYWFIDGQMNITDAVYFANILDGDEAHACMPKFNYLLQNLKNKDKIYVGDLKGYFRWFSRVFL